MSATLWEGVLSSLICANGHGPRHCGLDSSCTARESATNVWDQIGEWTHGDEGSLSWVDSCSPCFCWYLKHPHSHEYSSDTMHHDIQTSKSSSLSSTTVILFTLVFGHHDKKIKHRKMVSKRSLFSRKGARSISWFSSSYVIGLFVPAHIFRECTLLRACEWCK